ncbi:MAG: ABC transporter permease [Bradymonadia bacterium]
MRRLSPRQTLALVAALGPAIGAVLWGLVQPEVQGSAFALAFKLMCASGIAGGFWLLGHRRVIPQFIARRLVALVIVWIGAATLVFSALRMAPGDPVEAILGEQASAEARAELTEALCLNAPWVIQYNDCFWDTVFDGSLGMTFDTQPEPVIDRLAEHIPATVELALAGLAVALTLAFPLGLIAALKRATWIDHGATAFALVGVAVPTFWLGPMLLLAFTVGVDWLPNPGQTDRPVAALVLPAITLGTALAAKLTRMIRSSVLEVLHEPFVVTARAKGLGEGVILVKHVLRNALIPVITVLGLQFGALLTGAIVTEKVFARPGVGTLLLEAIQQRNYPLVQGTVLVIATTYVLVNLITDVLYAFADPRVRL